MARGHRVMIATSIHAAIGHTARTLARLCHGRRTVIVFDDRVPAATFVAGNSPHSLALPLGPYRGVGNIGGLAQKLRISAPEVVVAVGGGTTIDAVKMAALACRDQPLFAYAIRNADQRALTLLPRSALSGPEVIAVPTTSGTSSEVNAVAILETRRGRRLIVGEQLRPAHAVIDGTSLGSLPAAAIREGCFEALLRVAGRATGAETASDTAVELATALVRAGDGELDAAAPRVHAAVLSAATQSSAIGVAAPFAMKHWYLANEVSFVLGTRKVPATAATVSAVWRCIESGDARWGDRDGLRSLWQRVAARTGLPRSPAGGIDALVHRWRIPVEPRPDADDIERIAEATERAWGLTLPALRGIDRTDVSRVLRDAVWTQERR